MLTEENALKNLNEAVARLGRSTLNANSGTGIVICAGGPKYFPCAWVCINMLRKVGCSLPIELWHLGPAEMNETMRSLLRPLNVTCIDAHEVRKQQPVRTLNGWELKPYAIIHSSFERVISLDADNVPVVDPSFLLDTPELLEKGAIFWPDFGRLALQRPIWQLTGIEYQNEPEFESGQIVVDKKRCAKALALTMWFNEHSDFWYKHIHGDKETFHLAWRKLNQAYAMPSRGIHALSGTMCQHDFQGRRIFQHRNMAKWTIRGNRPINGFEFEAACMAFLEELVPHWPQMTGTRIYHAPKKSPKELLYAEQLVRQKWIYERVGYDKRPIAFRSDGTIAEGSAALEVFWDICEGANSTVELLIQSQDTLTCRLVADENRYWHGRWEQFERMPIEIRPSIGPSEADPDKDYSQYGEQTFILDFFSKTTSGYFLDIGASDGITHSNTRALALRGWKGMLVEPVPESFWRLEDTYANNSSVTLVNSAIAERDGYGSMWIVKAPTGESDFKDNRHTLDPSFAESVTRSNESDIYDVREVRLMSALSLLKKIGKKNVDFLSVDAEGMDASIISTLLEAGLRAKLILWEADKGLDQVRELEDLLSQHGYSEAFRTAVNRAWMSR